MADNHAGVSSDRLDADLTEQWDALIDWLRSLDDGILTTPTPLPGWGVRDLVAHLALAMGVLTGAEPVASQTTRDHDLASYLRAYADNARGIRDGAVGLAEDGDVIAAADLAGHAALEHLRALRAAGVTTVRVRRGVVDLDTLVLTRLVELVVHGDDLARSAPLPTPVDPTARTIVARALVRLLCARTGYDLQIADETAWVRLAAGRIGWDERAGALRSGNLAEGLPDLSRDLPLLA